jgi:hypothetical protein
VGLAERNPTTSWKRSKRLPVTLPRIGSFGQISSGGNDINGFLHSEGDSPDNTAVEETPNPQPESGSSEEQPKEEEPLAATAHKEAGYAQLLICRATWALTEGTLAVRLAKQRSASRPKSKSRVRRRVTRFLKPGMSLDCLPWPDGVADDFQTVSMLKRSPAPLTMLPPRLPTVKTPVRM